MSIRFGDVNLKTEKDDEFVQEVKITKVIQHPKYNQGAYYFDVAVLEVDPVKLSANVRPVCLPDSQDFDVDKFNQVCFILKNIM